MAIILNGAANPDAISFRGVDLDNVYFTPKGGSPVLVWSKGGSGDDRPQEIGVIGLVHGALTAWMRDLSFAGEGRVLRGGSYYETYVYRGSCTVEFPLVQGALIGMTNSGDYPLYYGTFSQSEVTGLPSGLYLGDLYAVSSVPRVALDLYSYSTSGGAAVIGPRVGAGMFDAAGSALLAGGKAAALTLSLAYDGDYLVRNDAVSKYIYQGGCELVLYPAATWEAVR